MEALEEALIFVFAIGIVSVILIYGIYWGNSVSQSYQISSIKNQFETGIKVHLNPNSIIISNSQQPILVNVKIKEVYENGSSVSTIYSNYSNLKLVTGSTTIPMPAPNPIYYSIYFYEPSTNNYIYSISGYTYPYYLHINNLYSGTEIYINNIQEKLPTSVNFSYIPLKSSYNNITILSKYFYINKIITTTPNQTIYNITLPTNFTIEKLTIFGFNGITSYPLNGVSVNINNLYTLYTNSSGEVSFPYAGNIVYLKVYYPQIQNGNYTNFTGIYLLPQKQPIILYKIANVGFSILLYYNYSYNEYVKVPGTVYLTSNIKDYSINSTPNTSFSKIIANYYNAVVTTPSNKTYGYYTNIPILQTNQTICFRLLLNGSFLSNYTCPPPPSLSPFNLIFIENGLPNSTLWNVTVNSFMKNSTTNEILFKEKKFVYYNYTVGSPIQISKGLRYSAFPNSGKVFSKGQNINVSITFAKQYYLTMSANTSSYGTVSPNSGWFNASSVIEINATPNQYYHFVSWTGIGNGSYSGTNSLASVVMNGPINETANFAPNEYIVYFNESGLPANTLWSVVFNGTSKSSSSNSINFTAIHNTYSFSINNVSINNTVKYVPNVTSGNLAVDSNITQKITFYPWYYLTMITNTTRGSVSPQSGWYKSGAIVRINATPNYGYTFVGWNGVGNISYTGTNSTANITMDGPITETANFTP